MKWLFSLLAVVAFFAITGCRHQQSLVEVPVYIHDTTQTVHELHDSIHIDHFREVTKMINDTIFVKDSVVIYRGRTKTDTVMFYREVPVLQKVEVYKEKELTKWQKFRLKSFWWLSVGLIGYILYRTRKFWYGLFGRL